MSNSGKATRTGMGHGDPPSPPLSDGQDLQYGLHHLQHHNAVAQYQPNPYAYDSNTGPYGSHTNFSSPEQPQLSINQYEVNRYRNTVDGSQSGYKYDQYGNVMYYDNQGSAYQGYHQPQYPAPVSYFASTPPTPVLSDQDGGGALVLRGNVANVPTIPSQVPRPDTVERSRGVKSTRATRATRQAKDDSGKPKVPKLTAPLSVLTKKFEHIPVKDMNAWVNRSDEARMKDVKKKNGYVTRPMNSFMMYRSAYAERTKIWCLQNNHQVVSAVSGESWPLEPPEVRDLYMEYARRERENHARAHPGYKFQPSKADASGRKRKGVTREVEEEEPSDLEDPEYEWKTSAERKGKGRAKRVKPLTEPYIPSALERSTYEFNNPGKPLPLPIGDQELQGQYWQQSVSVITDPRYHPSSRVEDVTIRRTEAPTQYNQVPSLIGLPGQQHCELLDLPSWDDSLLVNSSYGFFQGDHSLDPPIDPQLGPFLPGYESEFAGASVQELDDSSFSFETSSAPNPVPEAANLSVSNGMISSPYTAASSGGMIASRYSTAPAVTGQLAIAGQPAFQSQNGSQEINKLDQEETSPEPPPDTNPWVIEKKEAGEETSRPTDTADEPNVS